MKRHEDMIKNVHRRIDEYKAEQKKKHKRIAFAAAPVCAAAVVCAGLWTAGAFENTPDKQAFKAPVSEPSAQAEITQATVQSVTSAKLTTVSANTTASEAQTAAVTTAENAVEAETSAAKASVATVPEKSEENTDAPTSAYQEEVTQPVSAENHDNSSNSDTCDRLGDAYINGEYYLQYFGGTFTPDQFIGNGSDFAGFYQDFCPNAEFYTAKESSDIVIVRFSSGGEVTLKKTVLPSSDD